MILKKATKEELIALVNELEQDKNSLVNGLDKEKRTLARYKKVLDNLEIAIKTLAAIRTDNWVGEVVNDSDEKFDPAEARGLSFLLSLIGGANEGY